MHSFPGSPFAAIFYELGTRGIPPRAAKSDDLRAPEVPGIGREALFMSLKGYNRAMSRITDTPETLAELRREKREEMIARQLRGRKIRSERVLEAMLTVPRHEFVSEQYWARAYDDAPLPIGEGQTISQPYMVASMSEALELTGSERVLEVGTGSGYQAAVLGRLAREVYTIESRAGSALAARARLARLGGYDNVHVHAGDGTLGLPELAPFDAILVAAAAPEIPPPLVEQLAEGGRIVLPVGGTNEQQLMCGRKVGGELRSVALYYCRFVPLVGEYGW
jgi:protein-L-isoaspartate(D-aspartate) O-methyltransferase